MGETPFAAEFWFTLGGSMQIVAADGEVMLAMIDPERTSAMMTWTPDAARKFADAVEGSLAIAINGHDGLAQIHLHGDTPTDVAEAIRKAADSAELQPVG